MICHHSSDCLHACQRSKRTSNNEWNGKFSLMSEYCKTSSNQRLGECVRPKMESQVVTKEQGCWQTMPFNMPQMER